MSRALGRLRELFGDPLFVRTSGGMVPTPRAEALAAEVRGLLDAARALLQPAAFDPAALERTFVIGTSDYLEADLLPKLASALAASAPRVTLSTRPLGDREAALEALQAGRFDLVLGPPASLKSELSSQHLFDDTFLCAVRRDHPRIGRRLSLARYLELGHVLIAPRGTPGGPVDSALERLGLSRRVAARTQSFLSAPLLVARTDLLLTGPARLLRSFERLLGLRLLPPPFPLQGFAVHQGWHPRMQDDAAHRWLRALVARVAREDAPPS
jgi:DNA-binding transcriptional LysR family regulator